MSPYAKTPYIPPNEKPLTDREKAEAFKRYQAEQEQMLMSQLGYQLFRWLEDNE